MGLASQRAIVMRGDPGLFDILKKGIGIAAGFVPGGRIATTALGLIGGARRQGPALPTPSSIFLPGGVSLGGGRGTAPGPALATVGVSAGCPKGMHPNRSSYHTAAGFVERETRCVRNRRRNLSNGRANTRALRRMAAWEKQDKRRRIVLRKIAASAK